MRIPVKAGLTFGFSGLIIIFASLIILSSSFTSKKVLSTHARTIMENIASYTIDKAEDYLAPARNAAQLTRGLSSSNIVNSRNIDSMVAYFYEHLFLYPQFSNIYFGSVDGEFIMTSRYNQIQQGGYLTKLVHTHAGKRIVEKIYLDSKGQTLQHQFDPTDKYDPRERPWFRKAQSSNQLIWTAPYIFFTSRNPGITTAEPVYAGNGQFLGVIGVDIEIAELSTFISKLKVSQNGRAFILSQNGDVIAYPDVDKIRHTKGQGKARLTKIGELDDPITREAFLSLGLHPDRLYLDGPVFTSFEINGEKYNAMFSPFKDEQWPWIIGIYMPENDYLGAIKANRNVNILIAMIAVAIALFIGLLVARKLSEAKETAESADNAKSQFLTRMSHEIRTPMNAILGAGELLSETELNGDQKRYISIYRSAGEHLRELVSAVLDLSKIEANKFKLESIPFNLHTTVSQVCDVFFSAAKDKNLEFNCTIATGTPEHVKGDPTVLRQVLVNLVDNAIRFTPSGSISLMVGMVDPNTDDTAPDLVTIMFSVIDTGIGIPEDKQKMIFENFVQADGSTTRKYGGSGLGLAISQKLTALMGGEMTLTSEPDSGSIFSFSAQLKIDRDSDTPQDKSRHDTYEIRTCSKPKRILLVEDDERNRLLFTLFLKDIPHILETSNNGDEAVAKHFANAYDLILMDIEMPGMDGREATKRIRDQEKKTDCPPTPIIAVTAHALKEEQIKFKQAGCTGYLSKPVTKTKLQETVDMHLRASIVPKNSDI
jgi:signal transduction histidine kinase/CheY-like chemotaxis protein